MSETSTPHRSTIVVAIGVLAILEAVALLAGAVVYPGVRIPLGVVVLEEPRIVPATIVEGLCGLVDHRARPPRHCSAVSPLASELMRTSWSRS